MKALTYAVLLLAPAVMSCCTGATQTRRDAELRTLQNLVFEARNDVARLRTGDTALRQELSAELDDIRDEIVDVEVALREQESITNADLVAVRRRIETVRQRAHSHQTATGAGVGPGGSVPPEALRERTLTIPRGTEANVRLLTLLGGDAQPGNLVEAAMIADVLVGSGASIPAGSLLRGTVLGGKRGLSVQFDQLVIDSYPYRTRSVRRR